MQGQKPEGMLKIHIITALLCFILFFRNFALMQHMKNFFLFLYFTLLLSGIRQSAAIDYTCKSRMAENYKTTCLVKNNPATHEDILQAERTLKLLTRLNESNEPFSRNLKPAKKPFDYSPASSLKIFTARSYGIYCYYLRNKISSTPLYLFHCRLTV